MLHQRRWLRLLGIAFFVFLIWWVNPQRVVSSLVRVSPLLFGIAVLLNIPQILFKVERWRCLLRSQRIEYGLMPAVLAYFGSVYVGLLTPGRLGEFVKAIHVSQDRAVPLPLAFSGALSDRLFDLLLLLVLGCISLASLVVGGREVIVVASSLVLLAFPSFLLLNNSTFEIIRKFGCRLGRRGRKLFDGNSWLCQLRLGLRSMTWRVFFVSIALTVCSYILFFSQCYLLARAVELSVGFIQLTYSVALGSLVTLLPVSISGVGTRDAVIISFLAAAGVPPESGMSFSIAVFLCFYVAGGLFGAVAWWIKPIKLQRKAESQTHEILEG